jgi:hypothetical protein
MEYSQSDFSDELNKMIISTEQSFVQHCSFLMNEFEPMFKKKNQRLHLELIKNGINLFTPGYVSLVLVEIEPHLEKYKIKIRIPIWKCQRTILGIPVTNNIPYSKITGTLNTLENAKNVFKEFILDNLKKD